MTTRKGEVPTPTFMPVGTQGSVKTLTPAEVAATGARIVLANTYHLWLRPGAETWRGLGGLHAFTRWPHAMLTDSGGYQAFSLAERRTSSDDGFVFRSHLDGSKRSLYARRGDAGTGAARRRHRDAARRVPSGRRDPRRGRGRASAKRRAGRIARLAARRPEQAVFGIVQGGLHADLRRRAMPKSSPLCRSTVWRWAASRWASPSSEMHRSFARGRAGARRAARPRYLMGVGTPRDLVVAIGERRRHVRLRAPDPQRAQRSSDHPKRRHLDQAGPVPRRPGAHRRQCGCPCCQGDTRGPTCVICISREKFSVLRLLTPAQPVCLR